MRTIPSFSQKLKHQRVHQRDALRQVGQPANSCKQYHNQIITMNFLKIFRMLKAGLPVAKSFFRAYKQTVGGSKPNDDSFFGKYFNKVMSQNNLGAPPITESVALQILNIEKGLEEVDSRLILERYYTLFKKNDPKVGGTTYLQSKVYAAKECLMARFPDAEQQQQLFYKQVVEPEEKAEHEAKKAEEEARKAAAQELQKQQEKTEKGREDAKKQGKEGSKKQ